MKNPIGRKDLMPVFLRGKSVGGLLVALAVSLTLFLVLTTTPSANIEAQGW